MFKTLFGEEGSLEVSWVGVIRKEEGAREASRREEPPFIPFTGQSSVREDRAEQGLVEGGSE